MVENMSYNRIGGVPNTSDLKIDNNDNVEVLLIIEEYNKHDVIIPEHKIKLEIKEEPVEHDESISTLSQYQYDHVKYEVEIHHAPENSKSFFCETCWEQFNDPLASQEHSSTCLKCKKCISKEEDSDRGHKKQKNIILNEEISNQVSSNDNWSHLHLYISNNVNSIKESDKDLPKRRFYCEICNKSLSSRQSLSSHRRIHFVVKPYSCDLCDASFNQSNVLKQHKLIHTRNSPYCCDICNASFSQKSNLKTHRRRHPGTEKLYFCNVCNISFIQEVSLIRHYRQHYGEAPYFCAVCDMTFMLKCEYVVHKREHRYEKPFTCDLCGSAYFLEPNLKAHKRTHAAEKIISVNKVDIS